MYTVLLSGGSGKRLWPLSNSLRSKQYIKLLKHEDIDKQCSMVQRVWSQLEGAGLVENSVICASKAQVEILTSQLGNINIAVEPARRDTFPAVALSCAYLKDVVGAADDDDVCIIPVDPYTDKNYFETIKKLPYVLKKTASQVALMGVTPTYPSEKYGYIVPKKVHEDYIEVESFTEKPTVEKAKQLIQKGAIWNCGVFCLKIGDILKHCNSFGIDASYESIFSNYERLPKISFDYQILEKADKLAAVSFDGVWKDLGTWNSLAEEMTTNSVGNVLIDNSCRNTHVINELNMPVVTLGTSNSVIVASFDGILIADKSHSDRLKDVVDSFSYPPMYEERRWGTIKVIDVTEKDGYLNTTRKIKLFAGHNSSYHFHNYRDEVWTVVDGEAEFILNGVKQHLTSGSVVRIPLGAKHAVKAISDLEIIEIQFGNSIADQDLNRLTLCWDEIEYIGKDQM